MEAVEGTQISPKLQPPKKNNYIMQDMRGGYIIQRLKYLIGFQMFLGIYRLYLIGCRHCVSRFCHIYNSILILASVSIIIVFEFNGSQVLYKNTVIIEYVLLAISGLFFQQKSLFRFFSKLQLLDEKLNIRDDVKLTSPNRFYIFGVSAVLLYSFLEHTLYIIFTVSKYGLLYAASFGLLVHDVEIIFFTGLIIMVSRRLRVIKAHVANAFSMGNETESSKEMNKLQALSKKVNLDVSSLHQAYDLLYKCSQHLNSVMSFPITVMLAAAGFTTVLILKNLIHILQTEKDPITSDHNAINVVIAIGIGRCIKYIVLLVFPCYYANVTKTQVDKIRTMLHDTLNSSNELDKIERRKLKAFCQLCQDNAFLYEMWGVVRIDMTLPLGYSSLCTTYLIIFVQFSKFID